MAVILEPAIVTMSDKIPEYTSQEDSVLVTLFISQNDDNAFLEILRRHKGLIRKVLYTCLQNNEDMLDLEQDIYADLYRKLHYFKGKAKLSTFLYRLCRNKTIDFNRKLKHLKNETTLELVQPAASGLLSFEKKLELTEQEQQLNLLMKQLSESERFIIYLKDIEEKSLEEIQEITGLRKGTVKSRLHRSRNRLKSMWEKCYG